MSTSPQKIHLLYLEDSPMDVELSIAMLHQHGFQVDHILVQSKKEFLSALDNDVFDLVLADYNLPAFDGLSALALFKQRDLEIPFILVSGTVGEERAIESLKAGAVDYVLKTRLSRLGPVVERALHEAEDHRQRQIAEIALKKSEQDLKFLVDNTIDVIWQMDPKLNFTYVSPSIYDLTGFTQEEWLGTNLSEHATRKEFLKMAKHAFDGIKEYKTFTHVTFEGVMLRKDKSEVNVEINGKLLLNEHGLPYGLQGATRDISARVETQKQLRESEERFRIMYNNSPDMNVTVKPDTGEILLCNETLLEATGYTRDEVTGIPVFKLYHYDCLKKAKQVFDRFQLTGRIRNEELILRCKDGSKIPVSLNADAIHADNGEILYSIYSWRNITEQLKLQQQVQRYLNHQIAVNELAHALGETSEISDIYQTIYKHISQLMDVNSFAVSLYDQQEQVIRVKFALTDEIQVDVGTIPALPLLQLGKGRQGDVIHTGEPLYIDNYQKSLKKSKLDDSVAEHRRETKHGFAKERTIKSALYAPMKNQGHTIGVMQTQSYRMEAYSQEDIDLFCSLANVASISIQNAELVRSLEQANSDIAEAYDSTLEGWAKALELRDMETEGHSRRVVDLSIHLAQKMGISGNDLVQIQRGALLHDIGKMSVPDNILQKPGKLTEKEWEIMRQHPVYAYHWLSSIKYLQPCLDIPHYHHEKWDGSGYPNGLQGEQIPLSARIFAIVDVWDALLSDRPYREAWSKDRAIDYIAFHSEQNFDPDVVKAFLGLVAADNENSEKLQKK